MKLSKYAFYFVSELLCTALLVSFTCASQAILKEDLFSMSISYGLINFVLTSCFGNMSGGYGNPAVVLAFWLRRRISTKRLLIYTVAEMAGATIGHIGFNKIFNKISGDGLCLFDPKAELTDRNIMCTEFLLTFLLVMTWVVLWEYESELPMEFYIGGVNALIYLMGASLTGASTNPAKTSVYVLLVKKNQTALMCIAGQLVAGLAAPILWGCLHYMVK